MISLTLFSWKTLLLLCCVANHSQGFSVVVKRFEPALGSLCCIRMM